MSLLPPFGPSLLFCPGDRPDRFDKAASAADIAVLDLEDGVSPDRKDMARHEVVRYLRQADKQPMVRINHPATQRGIDDAAAVVDAGARILLLPKTGSLAEIRQVGNLRPDAQLFLVPTIESACGALAMDEILSSPDVAAVSWGPYDLAAELGIEAIRNADGGFASPIAHIRDRLIWVAAANDKNVLDTVTTEFSAESLLAADLRTAVSLGMIGKFAIHPRQIDMIRKAFMPSADKLDRYRRIVASDSGGAFGFEGEMVDAPIVKRARRYLMLADRYGDIFHSGV